MARDPLQPLRQHPEPPSHLEARVVAAVAAAGGLRPGRRWPRPALRAAAAVLIFVSGLGAGRWSAGRETSAPGVTAPRWMLLLGGDVTPGEDRGARAAEYGAWMREWARRGVAISGAELAGPATVLAGRAGQDAMAPLASAGGYFIVTAASEQEVVSLARTSPHLKYGGSVVVRRLVD